ncbi:beta strand repeat-containing protein [Flavobacterium sp.]|uniref:beta strand repeat-containing protein n=1 Tax=Flavobacterium sp. TaxID=239 RepID=UPI0037C0CC6A
MNKMLISKKLITLFLLLVNVFAYSQFVTTGIATSNSLYSGGNIGVGFTTLPVFGTNKFIVTGNSLFTGNTTVNGTGQFANLGLGVLPNTIYRLNVTGNSLFTGTTAFTGNTTVSGTSQIANLGLGVLPNTIYRLNVTGNSLFTGTTAFTGNTTVSGTSQIANLGLGVLPNTAFRLNVIGNSLFTGTTQTTGNVGIGIAPSAALSTKLSLASGIQGLSGLQFSNLTSAFVPTSSTNKFLTVDASGNVVLLNTTQTSGGTTITAGANITATGSPTTGYTISSPSQVLSQSGNTVSLSNGGGSVTFPTSTDSQTLSVAGNQLSISNGNTVTLPTISNTNLYNSNGTITNPIGYSGRFVNLNNNILQFSNSNNAYFGFNINPNPSKCASFNTIYNSGSAADNVFILPNTNKGYTKIFGSITNRRVVTTSLTTGVDIEKSWLQSGESNTLDSSKSLYEKSQKFVLCDDKFKPLVLNPLGGFVGIGLGQTVVPTAQLHTKGSVKLDNLGTPPPAPISILGTDANNQVFQFPASSLTPNNVNIYTDNGDLQDYRTVNLNQKALTFLDNQANFSNIFSLTSNGNTLNGYGVAINKTQSTSYLAPNLQGGGYNRNQMTSFDGVNLEVTLKTEGLYNRKAWLQISDYETKKVENPSNSAKFDLEDFGLLKPSSYLINPLGGNVGIGLDNGQPFGGTVTDPTAVLHTLGKLRFQDLPDDKKPNAILGTDTDGNVFEYDPSQFGGGANENIYNTNGTLQSNRSVSMASKTLTFIDEGNNPQSLNPFSFTLNPRSNDANVIIKNNRVQNPNLFGLGHFKISNQNSGGKFPNEYELTTGFSTNYFWTQASNKNHFSNDVSNLNYAINPLGGKVSIGTTNINLDADCPDCNNYRLFVAQGIRTEKVRVDIASVKGWADYVFAKDYSLMPLNDLEKFIKINGHLPNIPKAEEVVKEGIDLGAMDAKLLEKIEELTIHTIELNKKNEALEKEKIKQAKLIDDLAKRLEKLEKNTKQ